MKNFIFLFLFILSSCSSNKFVEDINYNFSFKNNMNFEQFKSKVKEYAKQSSYPNIDN